MQLCRYADMQPCIYAAMHLCSHSAMQSYRYAAMQLCIYVPYLIMSWLQITSASLLDESFILDYSVKNCVVYKL